MPAMALSIQTGPSCSECNGSIGFTPGTPLPTSIHRRTSPPAQTARPQLLPRRILSPTMSETLERPTSRLPAPVRGLRPRQWVKNLLVVLAPLAAGQLFQPAVLRGVALAFVTFCLVSSAVYLLNDIRDVEEDRLHPRKRFRPIAAGELSVPVAAVMAIVLGVGGLALGFWVDPALGITLAVYVAIQILYSTVLKHLPVIDLAVVSSGFLLRAIAGGVAVGVALSQWFLLVASFGSLFMVAGKRYSELISVGAGAGTRRSLDRYSQSYLRFVWILAAVLVVTFYSLWAFENRGESPARRTVDGDLDRPVHPGHAAVRARGGCGPGGRARGRRAARPRTARTGSDLVGHHLDRGVRQQAGRMSELDFPHEETRIVPSPAYETQLPVPQELVELHGWGRTATTRSRLAQIDSRRRRGLRAAHGRRSRRGPARSRPLVR